MDDIHSTLRRTIQYLLPIICLYHIIADTGVFLPNYPFNFNAPTSNVSLLNFACICDDRYAQVTDRASFVFQDEPSFPDSGPSPRHSAYQS